MKKLFFIAAIAGAALVSCTKNEVAESVNEQQEISFAAPVISPSTKVTEVADNYSTDLTFSVWAHYYDQTEDNSVYTSFDEGEVYMNEVVVEHDATIAGWKNKTTTYYWPKNGSLTFIAYSPSSVATYADVDANGIKFTDYVVGAPSTQVDLLYSERAYNKTAVDRTTAQAAPYASVEVNFKHALSSILFKVKAHADYAGTVLTVKKIEVLNAYSTGDFTQGLADQNGATTGQKLTIDGVETQTAAAWSDYATETTYTAYESATGIVLSHTNAVYTHNTTATATDNTTDLILLPQDLYHDYEEADDTEVTIKVTYTLKNKDMGEAIEQVAEVSLATGNAGGYFSDGKNSISAWEMGKKYTYTIEVGLDEIYFDPRVDVWTPVEVQPNIPIN